MKSETPLVSAIAHSLANFPRSKIPDPPYAVVYAETTAQPVTLKNPVLATAFAIKIAPTVKS